MLDARINEVRSELDEAKLRQEAEALLAGYEAQHKRAVAEAKGVKAAKDAEALRDEQRPT